MGQGVEIQSSWSGGDTGVSLLPGKKRLEARPLGEGSVFLSVTGDNNSIDLTVLG